MSRTHRKTALALAGAAGTILFAGCAAPPSSPSTSAPRADSFLPCIISDQGGFDDHSFNQLGYQGVKTAAAEVGSTFKAVQSATANDYASNLTNLVHQKCNLIVAAGFNLVDPVKAAAPSNPGTNFVMVDDNSIKAPNVKSVVFETDEAAFLGGYAAAAYSKTGVVGTWGGAQSMPRSLS